MRASRSILYFLAVAAPRIGMFAVIFALARLLPVAEVGLFVLVVTVGELLEMVTANWVRVYIQNREAGNSRVSSLRAGRMLAVSLLASVLALALVVPVAHIVADERWLPFATAAAVYVVAFGALRYSLGVLQALGRHGDVARIEATRTVGIILAVAAIFIEAPGTFLLPSLTLTLMTLAVALWGVRLSLRHVDRPRFTRHGLTAAAAFGLPMMGDTLLAYLLVSFDRFVLNEMIGPAAVGVYGVAYALGRQPIDFVAGPLNNLNAPALFGARAREGDERAGQMLSGIALTLFILCAAMVAGVFLLREPIVRLVLKPEFWPDTIWLMPAITAASCLIVFKMYVFDNIFYIYGQTALKLRITVPVGIASLGLTFVLVWRFGLVGAAWALFLGSAAALVSSIIGSRRFFRFPLALRKMAEVIGLVALASGALLLATMALRPFGPLAEVSGGFTAFTLVYATGLWLAGVSLKSLLATPWAPLQARPVSRQ